MKVKELISPNDLDLKGKELTLPNVYDKKNLNIGASTGVEVVTAVIKDEKGRIWGRRSFYQKKAK